MADSMNALIYSMNDPEGFAAYENKEAAKAKAEAQAKAQRCYVPEVMSDGKLQCPVCKQVEGGTLRIITHKYQCLYNGKPYCDYKPPMIALATAVHANQLNRETAYDIGKFIGVPPKHFDSLLFRKRNKIGGKTRGKMRGKMRGKTRRKSRRSKGRKKSHRK